MKAATVNALRLILSVSPLRPTLYTTKSTFRKHIAPFPAALDVLAQVGYSPSSSHRLQLDTSAATSTPLQVLAALDAASPDSAPPPGLARPRSLQMPNVQEPAYVRSMVTFLCGAHATASSPSSRSLVHSSLFDANVLREVVGFLLPTDQTQLRALNDSLTALYAARHVYASHFHTTLSTLVLYCHNIVASPGAERFRSIHITSRGCLLFVVAVPEAMALLEAIGFNKRGVSLLWDDSDGVVVVRKALAALKRMQRSWRKEHPEPDADTAPMPSTTTTSTSSTTPSSIDRPVINYISYLVCINPAFAREACIATSVLLNPCIIWPASDEPDPIVISKLSPDYDNYLHPVRCLTSDVMLEHLGFEDTGDELVWRASVANQANVARATELLDDYVRRSYLSHS